MGWVAIPLAVLGLAALSGGGGSSYEYATYQECTYAPPAYGYAAAPQPYAYGQPAPAPGYGASYGYAPQASIQGSVGPQQAQFNAYGDGYGGYGGAYAGTGGYDTGVSAGVSY